MFFGLFLIYFYPLKKNRKKKFFTVSGLGLIKHVRHGMSQFFENGYVDHGDVPLIAIFKFTVFGDESFVTGNSSGR